MRHDIRRNKSFRKYKVTLIFGTAFKVKFTSFRVTPLALILFFHIKKAHVPVTLNVVE